MSVIRKSCNDKNLTEICSCEDCRTPKTCLYYDKRKNKNNPGGLYGLMIETLSQQESFVETQKTPYLPQSKDSCPTCSEKVKSKAAKNTCRQKGKSSCPICSEEGKPEATKNASRQQSKGGCTTCSKKAKPKATKNVDRQQSKASCPICSEKAKPEATKNVDRQQSKDSCTTCLKKAKPKATKNVDRQQSKDSCSTCLEKAKPKVTKNVDRQQSKDSCTTCLEKAKPNMTDCLSKQQSAVEMQKCIFICDSDSKPKCSCCKPSDKQGTNKHPINRDTYKDMMDTLTQQKSAVETQKYAYLGNKSSSAYLGNKLSGIYEYMIDTLSRLTSSVRKQEDAYNINCCTDVQEDKPKAVSEKKSEPKLCTTTSSTGPCMVEHLKSSIEYSLQGKHSKCRFNSKISHDEGTTTPSKSCGSMIEPKKSSCNCSNNKNKQLLNINRLEIKRISFDKMPYLNSECRDLAESKHELPRYYVESKRYNPTKSAQKLFKNIIQTHANKYQNTSDECDTETSEYLIEPSKYRSKPSLRNEFKCKPTEKYSESYSYVPGLQKYMTIPNPGNSENSTRKFHNRYESKLKTSDRNNSFVFKKQTHHNDLAQKLSENSGYAVELQNIGETENNTQKAHIYRCESRWIGSDPYNSLVLKNQRCCHDNSALNKTGNEYVVEIPKVKEKKKCYCRLSAKHDSDNYANETVSEKTGKCQQNTEFTNELPQRTTKPSQQNACHNSSTLCQSGSQQKSYGGFEYENEGCERCDSGKKDYKMKPTDIPGYVFEISKYTQDGCDSNISSKKINIQSVCKSVNVIDTPSRRTPAVEMQKGTSEYNTQEPHSDTCCESKWIASDANNSLLLKKQTYCRDNDSAQKIFGKSGNLMELQNTGKSENNTRKSHYKKQICLHDDDSAQKKTEVGGYVIDLTKIKENRNCDCKGSTKPDCDKHAMEKVSEKKTFQKSTKHKNEIMALASELPKCYTAKPSQQNSDACHKSSTPYQCGAQQKGYDHPESEGRECGNSGKNAFKMTPFKGPGYVVEITKETQGGCDFNISRKKSILSKTSINSQVNYCHCDKPTKENIESTSPIKCSSNTYSVLCNNILKKQTDEIEKLKKIYLPKKGDVIKLELPQRTRCLPLLDLPETCRSSKKINAKGAPSNKPKKVSESYILDKINKLYNACRCATCECAPSKSVGIDAHECQHNVRCDNEGLSTILSKATKASDCYRCKTMNIHHCQSLIVAPVRREENISHLACTCLPCACFESGIVCPLAHNAVKEMSTSINRHALCRCEVCLNESCDRNGFDSCKCQKYNRFMSKLVEHDTRYFDIWTAKVVHNKSTFEQIQYSQLFLSGAGTKTDFNDPLNNYEFKMPSEYQKDNKKQNHGMTCETKSQKYLSNIPFNVHEYLKNVACERHLKVPTCSIPEISSNSNSSTKHESVSDTTVNTGLSANVNIFMKDFNSSRCIDECTSFTINGYMCLQCQEGNERSLCKETELQNEISENCFSGQSEINRLQNLVCLTDDQSFLKEKHEYYQAINDFNEFHVALKAFDNNISERNTAGRILPKYDQVDSGRSPEETPIHSDSINSAEMLNVNYERVRNTLKKANDFSLELIKLLETYEKANREFQSISEKRKLSHMSLPPSSVADDSVK